MTPRFKIYEFNLAFLVINIYFNVIYFMFIFTLFFILCVILDSERSNEYIDFTIMCALFMSVNTIISR